MLKQDTIDKLGRDLREAHAEAMLATVGLSGNGPIARTFHLMGVAEEEIAAAKRRWRRAAKRLHGAFEILCPPPGMSSLDERVYRSHVRELLGRVARGEDTRPGTMAQILVVMSETSFEAPLNHAGMATYEHAFAEVFGEGELPGGKQTAIEPWDGCTAEGIAGLRVKFRDDGRVLGKEKR